jgi:hypothetical protein
MMWPIIAGLAAVGSWLFLSKPSPASVVAGYIKSYGQPAAQFAWLAPSTRAYRIYTWTGEPARILIVGGAAAGQPMAPDFHSLFTLSSAGTMSQVDSVGGDAISQQDTQAFSLLSSKGTTQ